MCPREDRGKVIAETCTVKKAGKLWHVPSQSGRGTYTVNLERVYCSCPDFIERGEPCKHIFAVRFTVTKTETHADGSETVTTVSVEQRTTYKQDWPNYNAAQVNEHRHFMTFLADLCGTLPPPAPKPGRPPLLPSDAAFCAIYKVYSTMSARRFAGDLEEAHRLGHITRVPHFNSVLNFFDGEGTADILQRFVALSAAPLANVETKFAADSTGFSGASHVRWFDEKYGRERSEVKWVKLHGMIGVKTNVIAACKVAGKESTDGVELPGLVTATAEQFCIDEVSADKAYTSRNNFAAVEGAGGQFYPAFKKNATGKVGGAYERAFLLMRLNEEEYAKHYHLRSNAESTFSALKRKFGPALRSKTERAMRNEVLAKVVAYNLTCVIQAVYELGIAPEFVFRPRP
ncbi:MAG: transposase [Gemmataceae bacterium]